jgi:xylitol oxidase
VKAVEQAAAAIEAALSGLEVRPHWGKVFTARADALVRHYPRLRDFRALRAELDPRGASTNAWLRERVLGDI